MTSQDRNATDVLPDTKSPDQATPHIELRDVAVQFGADRIFSGLSFAIAQGEFVCLLGPSGCGKSTMIRIMGGLIEPTHGFIRVGGRSPQLARGTLAYVFQSPRLVPWRNARDNVGARHRAAHALRRQERAPRAGDQAVADGGARSRRRQVSGHAVGGRAPAGCHRSRPCGRSQHHPDGRAVLRARSRHAPAHARRPDRSYGRRRARRSSSSRTTWTRPWSWPTASCVFSGKPTRILDIVDVGEPRPRTVSGSPTLRSVREHLLQLFKGQSSLRWETKT